MSRSNTWDENTPDGDVDESDELDDFMRVGKVDLREIVNQIAGVAEATPLADPAVPVDRNLGALRTDIDAIDVIVGSQAFTRTISWLKGKLLTSSGTVNQTSGYLEVSDAVAGAATLFVPLWFPVGTIITKVAIRVRYVDPAATTTASFDSYTDGAQTAIVAVNAPVASGAPQWAESGTISHTILADKMYSMAIGITTPGAVGNPVRLYGLRITGTSPSASMRQ